MPRWPTRSTGWSRSWPAWTVGPRGDGRNRSASARRGVLRPCARPPARADSPGLSARFGPDDELVRLVDQGELDLAVTSSTPGRRSLSSVLSAGDASSWWLPRRWPRPIRSTRWPTWARGWSEALGRLQRRAAADQTLLAVVVGPDLRRGAPARGPRPPGRGRRRGPGLGVSLLPDFVCAEALERGAVVELFPVGGVVPTEPWFACTRVADTGQRRLTRLVEAMTSTAGPQPQGLSRARPAPDGRPRGRRSRRRSAPGHPSAHRTAQQPVRIGRRHPAAFTDLLGLQGDARRSSSPITRSRTGTADRRAGSAWAGGSRRTRGGPRSRPGRLLGDLTTAPLPGVSPSARSGAGIVHPDL